MLSAHRNGISCIHFLLIFELTGCLPTIVILRTLANNTILNLYLNRLVLTDITMYCQLLHIDSFEYNLYFMNFVLNEKFNTIQTPEMYKVWCFWYVHLRPSHDNRMLLNMPLINVPLMHETGPLISLPCCYLGADYPWLVSIPGVFNVCLVYVWCDHVMRVTTPRYHDFQVDFLWIDKIQTLTS